MKVTPQFITNGKTIVLAYRLIEMDEGEDFPGHKHFIDHPTIFIDGKFRLDYVDEQGIAGSETVTAPCWRLIKAGVIHGVTALTDGKYHCMFVPPPNFESACPEFWGDAESV